jgi:hypothetical protein
MVRKRGAFLVAGDSYHLDVGVEVILGVVMGGHLVPLAALFVEPKPSPPPFGVVILHLHAEGGGDAGEAEDHDADQGPVPQADEARRAVIGLALLGLWPDLERDAVEECSRLVGFEDGRLALLDDVLGGAHGGGGIHFEHLADDQPVEEHPQGRQVLLDGGGGVPGRQLGQVAGDVVTLDGVQAQARMARR